MSASIINVGSINIDHIYRVPHLVHPGETLPSRSLTTVLGGKGANQSVALARAGVAVAHVGKVSSADEWAVALLRESGVDTTLIQSIDGVSGHAIIQVDDEGENSIILHGGANRSFSVDELGQSIATAPEGTRLLVQNECNLLAETIELALAAGLLVALNPAPMTSDVRALPLERLDTLIVNKGEGEALSGEAHPDAMLEALIARAPDTRTVITLGADGALMYSAGQRYSAATPAVKVVDTTGAGDTFVGYLLAGLMQGLADQVALQRACRAAAIAVTRAGATPSIPVAAEVE